MHQDIVLNPGDSVSISVAPVTTPVAEVIADVKVENTDGTSETLVPEATA